MEKLQNDQRKEKAPMRTELWSGEENLHDSGRDQNVPPPDVRAHYTAGTSSIGIVHIVGDSVVREGFLSR